jgi:hypothetical protein
MRHCVYFVALVYITANVLSTCITAVGRPLELTRSRQQLSLQRAGSSGEPGADTAGAGAGAIAGSATAGAGVRTAGGGGACSARGMHPPPEVMSYHYLVFVGAASPPPGCWTRLLPSLSAKTKRKWEQLNDRAT